MMPLVSILIPAYRAERWICETIMSALRRTWPIKEIFGAGSAKTGRRMVSTIRIAAAQ
jgi:hypothetical protein